jgi:hypothetical protein
MPARRFVFRTALAAIPLALAACVSYPFLTEEDTTGTTDGSASTGTGGSGTGTGTGGGTGTTNSNQNVNGAPDLPTSATGDVAQELCDGFIVISERDGSRALHVYALIGEGSFADWSAGEDIGFDAETGALVNFSDDENVTAEIIGEYGGNYNELVHSVTLQNGSVWLYGLDDAEEVRLWRTSSDQITQVDVDATHAIIVNRTRCTSIAGSSQ